MIKNHNMMLVLSLAILGAVIFGADCVTPTPIPPPPNPPIENVDAPIVQPTSFQELCKKLSDFGCAEGDDPDCAFVFEQNESNAASVANLDVPCLVKATNVEALKECKSVECKPKYGTTRRTNPGVQKCATTTMGCPP